MRNVVFYGLFAILVSIANGASAVTLEDNESATTGVKRALLIGVNQYAVLNDLGGAVNDVEIMRTVLIERFGFDPGNMVSLIDAAATRAAIIANLQDLVSRSGPDDTLYIHFSGHGSQAPDQNGDEPDGFDETICPHDARTPDVPDITDDELEAILAQMDVAAGLVVLDSCHSGTALRDVPGDIRRRSVPPDSRSELYARLMPATRGAVVPLQAELPYVLFSASAADQVELDGPFGPQNQSMGLLTASLSSAMQTQKRKASPRQILDGVEQVVAKLKPRLAGHPIPEAQLEGPEDSIDRALFTPTRAQPDVSNSDTPTVTQTTGPDVPPIDEPDIAQADEPLVIPPNEEPPVPLKDEVLIPQTDDAPPASAPAASGGTRLLLTGANEAVLRAELPKTLTDRIEWVDAPSKADVVIHCENAAACDVYGPAAAVRIAALRDLALEDDPGEAIGRIARVVTRAEPLTELLSLEPGSGAIDLKMSATGKPPTRQVSLGERGIKLVASVSNHPIRFHDGEEPRNALNSLQLSVTSDTGCYLTVASVDTSGDVVVLLPNPLQMQRGFLPNGYIEQNQTVLIPDSFEPANAAGFYLDYAPPAGTETIRAICTTTLDAAHALRREMRAIATGEGKVSLSEVFIERRGLTGLRPNASPEARVAWASATLTIDIGGA